MPVADVSIGASVHTVVLKRVRRSLLDPIEDEDFKTWYGVVSLTLYKNIVKTFKEKAIKDQSWNDKHIQKEMSEANAYL